MHLTNNLRKWVEANCDVTPGAADRVYRAAAVDALASGTLSGEQFADLQKDVDESAGNALTATLKSMQQTLLDLKTKLDREHMPGHPSTPPPPPSDDEEDEEDEMEYAEDNPGVEDEEEEEEAVQYRNKPSKPKAAPALSAFEKALADMGASSRTDSDSIGLIRVRGAHEQYDGTKTAATYPLKTNRGVMHPNAGQPVRIGNRQLDLPSQRDQAIMGAWLKWHWGCQLAPQVPAALRLNDHEKDLLQFALKHERWGGVIHGEGSEDTGSTPVKNRKLSDMEVKAIVDDTTSGGLEIAPIVFDDSVILFPVLFGELFPLVNTVEITRGRRIEGASITNPTLTSAGSVVDNTLIPLNATTGFITAFDTTIHVVHGAIEFGLDLLSDTPIDLSGIVTQKYGEVMMSWLDEQIAIGDGTTEPQGIMNAAATTTVNHSNAAPTVGGYESLLFGVPKRYKQGVPVGNVVFCANETTYSRARGIAVGAGDARRVFGLNEENYQLFGHPYKIVENMANTQIFFAVAKRYRMYRRLGLTSQVTRDGRELVLRNKMLLSVRARFGGQLEDGAAAAVVTDAQA